MSPLVDTGMNGPATPILERDAPVPSHIAASTTTNPDGGARRAARVRWLVLGVVWAGCAVYALHHLRHGWVPHDEGTLAQSAERVLRGELPHRDFDAVYTGGLAMVNAAAFRLLGANLLALRLVLFAAFLLWIPALYYIATRIAGPVAAGAAVLLAAAWSLPNYSAALPSWYNLFLATAGAAALLRHIERGERRWLVAAGVCGGLSCLIKIVGVYFIGAALLVLVYREQCLARDPEQGEPRRDWWYPLFVTAGLAAFVAVLVALTWRQLGWGEAFHFVLPGALAAAVALLHEWATPPGRDARRFRALARLVAPLALGVLLPVALFLIPYVHSGSVGALVEGVFIAPARRLRFAAVRPPFDWGMLIAIVPLPFLAGIIPSGRARLSWITKGLIGGVLLVLVIVSARRAMVYWLIWRSMRALVSLVVLGGAWLLVRGGRRLGAVRRQQLVALLATTALCALVQFPFAAPVYFFYVAPLVVLTGLAVIALQPRVTTLGPAAIAAFYLLFAVLRIHPGFIHGMGHFYVRDEQTVPLALDRGGVDVTASDAEDYARLVRLLRAHAAGGYTFAAPDCPQVYFLAGLRNPTRTLYDFFDDTTGRTARVLGALEARHVTVIAINQLPEFSGPVPEPLERALEARYPRSERVGSFVVRWRE
ncbi:MAG TPA: glycosyltransferase family 39 protein [Gemmatimonadaceae bacterium]